MCSNFRDTCSDVDRKQSCMKSSVPGSLDVDDRPFWDRGITGNDFFEIRFHSVKNLIIGIFLCRMGSGLPVDRGHHNHNNIEGECLD